MAMGDHHRINGNFFNRDSAKPRSNHPNERLGIAIGRVEHALHSRFRRRHHWHTVRHPPFAHEFYRIGFVGRHPL